VYMSHFCVKWEFVLGIPHVHSHNTDFGLFVMHSQLSRSSPSLEMTSTLNNYLFHSSATLSESFFPPKDIHEEYMEGTSSPKSVSSVQHRFSHFPLKTKCSLYSQSLFRISSLSDTSLLLPQTRMNVYVYYGCWNQLQYRLLPGT